MTDTPAPYQFNDGAAYEQFMSPWSRMVGAQFLDWIKPAQGLRWVDVGCGNGAFTELLVERCAPAAIGAVDPSEGQLTYARGRTSLHMVDFRQGDALALPYNDAAFDAAAMALVIFFVPDPAKAVREMARVVRPGGMVATYAWDVLRGGAPMQPVWDVMEAMGITATRPPSAAASRLEVLADLWREAGLNALETCEIVVGREFPDFDTYWTVSIEGSPNSQAAKLPQDKRAELKRRLMARLPRDAGGRIRYHSRATAIKGRVAG